MSTPPIPAAESLISQIRSSCEALRVHSNILVRARLIHVLPLYELTSLADRRSSSRRLPSFLVSGGLRIFSRLECTRHPPAPALRITRRGAQPHLVRPSPSPAGPANPTQNSRSPQFPLRLPRPAAPPNDPRRLVHDPLSRPLRSPLSHLLDPPLDRRHARLHPRLARQLGPDSDPHGEGSPDDGTGRARWGEGC